jgi:phosphatidylinositol glycan class V
MAAAAPPRSRAGRVLCLALASRLAMLAVMAAADAGFEDLSSSAHLQNFPCAGGGADATPGAATPLDGLAPWDSVYFVRIAKCGYEVDTLNAFFPLLPGALRAAARLPGAAALGRCLPPESLFALAGLALSAAAFCAAALALHALTLRVLGDAELADLAAILFCFNPASVFYSAVYTEALFAACTWTGLLLLPERHWAGVAALAAAAAARSNGILGCWFVLHAYLVELTERRGLSLQKTLRLAASCAAILAPYAAMQARGYVTYCLAPAHAAARPTWCAARLPSLYAHVQRKYWDVGLLRFYRNEVWWPHFLQSSPVWLLAAAACWAWASADWRRALSLCLRPGRGAPPARRRGARRPAAPPLAAAALAPYAYHLALMAAAALLAMHLNVATRFLSSSPLLYWAAAARLRRGGGGGAAAAAGWAWALAFCVLGGALFPNFFPWT